MKKNSRISFLAALWWVIACLCLGVLLVMFAPRESRPSEEENRMLAGFPELNAQTLASGAFFSGIEDFLSDGFFARAQVVDAADAVLEVFNRQTEEQRQMQEKPKQTACWPRMPVWKAGKRKNGRMRTGKNLLKRQFMSPNRF